MRSQVDDGFPPFSHSYNPFALGRYWFISLPTHDGYNRFKKQFLDLFLSHLTP
ncbi:hypothetical protein VCRA2113O415_350003 [Vibrio crassostreae]|nr:hypothetical protein VCRA2113O415_350003 [Vibrio crassostreae]CAK2800626.1 hypothetical protein VCRA2113O420_340003 [Vibrio crassostreae]CAK3416703.1 hypothetical protein VCRA2121O436_350003 [Vibrio crassostreae]